MIRKSTVESLKEEIKPGITEKCNFDNRDKSEIKLVSDFSDSRAFDGSVFERNFPELFIWQNSEAFDWEVDVRNQVSGFGEKGV